MIITIITLILAFYWLLRETNYLRIRLERDGVYPIGVCCQWHLPDSAVTEYMKTELLNKWTNLPKLTRVKFEQGIESPMCGWGYAYQYRDFTPEYEIELLTEHSKITLKTQSTNILKDCFRVYRNPWLKVNLKPCKADMV